MSDTLIARSEIEFLLWDWLGTDRHLGDAIDRTMIEAVIDLSERLARETFLPHYKAADAQEPWLDAQGDVHILPDIAQALRHYAAAGLFGASFPEECGGLALPFVVACASQAFFMAANIATAAYPMLTVANARVILAFGSEAQIEAFARPQIAGAALGTMCLSEPQAGSALGEIRTRALPDGADALGERYRLFGTKMWISGGDHDATHDIVHLVLAKIPGEDGALPGGTRGISLFVVPRHVPTGRNDIAVAGLNHKMGYRGTANCLLNFGEGRFTPAGAAGAIGYRLGDPGQGLAMMFRMMNEARIGVGLGAAALACRGYALSRRYAGERVQGHALDAAQGGAPVAIERHPDVQHMLLAQHCYAFGGLALVLYCAVLVDRARDDPQAAGLLALLTPIAKSFASEWGPVANSLAIQVHGGYGYTRDFDVEQLYRDNRLNPIHEGTTGIQAIDLVGRKILRDDGAALDHLGSAIAATLAAIRAADAFGAEAAALEAAWQEVLQTVAVLRGAERAVALANATAFLQAFGHVVVGWLWLDQVRVTLAGAPALSPADRAEKHRACRYFYLTELPKTAAWLAFVRSLDRIALQGPRPV